MRSRLGQLQIDRIIVHDVPTRLIGDANAPRLSEIESTLDAELRTFFQERIRASLASSAVDVLFDLEIDSPTRDLVFDQLGAQQKTFVEMSRELATHLANCQSRVNSPGILAVIEGRIAADTCLAVLKLERETGVRLEETDVGGLMTFDIEHVRNLMLTDKTKVFKAALFVQGGTTVETVAGLLSDQQRGATPRNPVASFFLHKFLGCELREAPEETTRKFFITTQDFINEHVEDPDRRARYLVALLATLNSNEPSIAPMRFAENNLVGSDRQAFLDLLEQEDIPTSQIDKDIGRIRTHLNRMQWGYQSGLTLVGPVSSFEQHVTTESLEGGQIRTEIRDVLTDVNAR